MKILVTAGPTREAIDPVRFISNRSSGKMGYAIAAVAAERRHDVRMISGPVALAAPPGVQVTYVISADEMLTAVQADIAWCEVLVMSAAVADWRPREYSADKLKKETMSGVLELERTADILTALRPMKGSRLFVGFAAETGDVIHEAERKLREKGLDMIVANNVAEPDSGFAVDTNRVTLLVEGEVPESWPLMSKREVALRLVETLEEATF